VRALTKSTPTSAAKLLVEWIDQIDSTQSELLRRAHSPAVSVPQALIAGMQTAGRGRAGRSWVSAGAGQNLYLSMLMRIPLAPQALAPITVALGVAALRVLSTLLADARPTLKWPNDLMIANRKVGGILVEVARMDGPHTLLVAGIGINLRMPADVGIDQAFTDLASHGVQMTPARLASIVASAWLAAAQEFCTGGLRGFLADYHAADALLGQVLELVGTDQLWVGDGLDDSGAYRLRRGEITRLAHAGEMRLRLPSRPYD
jgi:BirA family transcriptional regulator, biotin operon repressor / biotin---[acetyl-CoA-carboxylase] ligase